MSPYRQLISAFKHRHYEIDTRTNRSLYIQVQNQSSDRRKCLDYAWIQRYFAESYVHSFNVSLRSLRKSFNHLLMFALLFSPVENCSIIINNTSMIVLINGKFTAGKVYDCNKNVKSLYYVNRVNIFFTHFKFVEML